MSENTADLALFVPEDEIAAATVDALLAARDLANECITYNLDYGRTCARLGEPAARVYFDAASEWKEYKTKINDALKAKGEICSSR